MTVLCHRFFFNITLPQAPNQAHKFIQGTITLEILTVQLDLGLDYKTKLQLVQNLQAQMHQI